MEFTIIYLFWEKWQLSVYFQGLAKIMVVCQFLISGCLSMSLLISSPNTRVLDICLGNYEQDFLKSSGVQVCTIGKSWQRILCVSSLIIHTVMSSNVLDAIFLYICFNKIKHQTEKLKKIIGKKAYELRKRYVWYFVTKIVLTYCEKKLF